MRFVTDVVGRPLKETGCGWMVVHVIRHTFKDILPWQTARQQERCPFGS